MKPCSAGEPIENDCHRVTDTNYRGLLDVQNLSDEEKNLLWLRLRRPEHLKDCLCGLVVKVSGYRPRGPGFDSRPFQMF
jgi:hypothetical protein